MHIPASELQRNFGRYQDKALLEPLMITRNGRERLVILSIEEYRRLRQHERQALPVTALPDDLLEEINAAEVPPAYSHLDTELE